MDGFGLEDGRLENRDEPLYGRLMIFLKQNAGWLAGWLVGLGQDTGTAAAASSLYGASHGQRTLRESTKNTIDPVDTFVVVDDGPFLAIFWKQSWWIRGCVYFGYFGHFAVPVFATLYSLY